MLDIDFTFLFTAINLLILYFFLNKFLFKRLGGFMEERSASIAANIEGGQALKAEGDAYRLEYEQMLKNGAEQGKQMLEEARKKAEKEYDAIVAEAKKEAAWIVANAKEEVKQQQNQIYLELKEKVAGLAILAASKIIEANMDNDKNRKMVESFLSKEGAA